MEKKLTQKTKGEFLPPEMLSAGKIKNIVFDLLGEEDKTPESYEISKDAKGVQTFVLKFTDGTTNEHSVRGVLGLRLKIPIFDLEGIEPVNGGKNFRLVWKEGLEKETEKSPEEIEVEKLIARKQEIAKEKEEIGLVRATLLKKLEEINRNKKK
ncbi:MAG: hypothetical protein ACKOW9_04100 [Candidatus Paceibacterota bacterium]